jgi:two-component system phosphate regulon sensor histidine kinase PhoR
MKGKSIILLVLFMTISVIGIRMMQVQLRENDIKLRNQRFYYLMNQILYAVTSKAQNYEFDKYYKKFQEAQNEDDSGNVYEFVYKKENKNTNEVFAYKHLVLEKGINLKFPISEQQFDSVFGKLSVSKTKSNFFRHRNIRQKNELGNKELANIDNRYLETTFKDISVIEPIYKRVSVDSLKNWLQDELFKRGIDYHYEFAILNDGILTKVHSKHFKPNDKGFKYYKFSIFPDKSGLTKYELVLAFNKNELFKHESMRIQFLSDLLMIIILLIYVLTIYFIIRQKRISQMKTDFINNMTHEFKTPIATINLIVDAMKSPRVIKDENQIKTYLNMLKQENKRMLNQVENVLSLSVLDRIDSKIERYPVDIHEILEVAIQHVSLLIQDKGGYLKKRLQAQKTQISGDETLLTNVFVNIFDNAIKYSKEQPEIEVVTFNDKKGNLVIEISDKGIGMSKSVQKKIFDKFYRESTGDIHNVKGHGLGLAYVQKVVQSLHGKISVKSTKGEGSTFILRFPTL